MRNNKKLWEICKEIYTEMYRQSEPKADFKDLVKKYEGTKIKFFEKYYLQDNRQVEIINEICKKHKVTKWERKKIDFEIHLGCSPNTSKEQWEIKKGEKLEAIHNRISGSIPEQDNKPGSNPGLSNVPLLKKRKITTTLMENKPDTVYDSVLVGTYINVYEESDVVGAIKELTVEYRKVLENRKERLQGLREFRDSKISKEFELEKVRGRIKQLVEDLRFWTNFEELFVEVFGK